MIAVAYLSHPIGPPDQSIGGQQASNVDDASRWLRLLVSATKWAVVCPWLAYTTAVGDALYGPKALVDQIAILERCDLLVQIGGWVSPHMEIERNHANRIGIPVASFIDLGPRPPKDDKLIAEQIRVRARRFDKARRRRVWLPPLENADVEALRAAQIALRADPFSADAVAIMQRIIQAAMRR